MSSVTVLSFYNEVTDDQVIWRYMDFPKFFSLIETKTLFFCPAYHLKKKEPFEYEMPALNEQKWRKETTERLLKSGKDPNSVEEYLDKTLSGPDIFHWGVSCWSSNPIESYALWRTFVTAAEGVTIKSCPAKLQAAVKLSDKEFMRIGNVQYLDYDKDQLEKTLFTEEDRLFCKAKFYEHERELRIITYPVIDPAEGMIFPESLEDLKFKQSLTVPVVLEELIEEVRVSPYASRWFYDLVSDYVRRAKLPAKVVQSSIRIGS